MEKENVENLEFGEELGSDLRCLTNAEVFIIMSQKKEQMTEDFVKGSVFDKTLSYVEDFGGEFGQRSTVRNMRKELSKERYDLHEFEISSLANLMPTSVGEAKALIPSLKSKDDELIGQIVEFLETFHMDDVDEEVEVDEGAMDADDYDLDGPSDVGAFAEFSRQQDGDLDGSSMMTDPAGFAPQDVRRDDVFS